MFVNVAIVLFTVTSFYFFVFFVFCSPCRFGAEGNTSFSSNTIKHIVIKFRASGVTVTQKNMSDQ